MTPLQWGTLSDRLFDITVVIYVVGIAAYALYAAFGKPQMWVAARTVAIIGVGVHVVSIVSRGLAADRVPWGNMWEYSSLLACLVVVAYLVIVEGVYKVKTLGWVPLLFAAGTMGVARLSGFYVSAGPLVPALNSYWLKIHVLAAIVGSSLFALGGGVLTILFLIKLRAETREARALGAQVPPPIMGGAIDVNDPPHFLSGADEPVGRGEKVSKRRAILPPSAVLDKMAYRTIAFAFPIWTFAVIAGAIWAQEAWGRYWGWDPKETWAFITWVIYAGYLHARATSGWKGVRAAVVALVGFASLLVTYYVVNLFIVGLHSYAR